MAEGMRLFSDMPADQTQGTAVQLGGVAMTSLISRLAFPENGRLVAVRPGEMPIEAILRKIDFSADEPFRKRRFPFQNFPPRLLPGELIRLARPEFVRLLDR